MDSSSAHSHELRLERAAEHLRTLDDQFNDWLIEAYRYVAELDPRSGKKHITVKMLNPPPATLRPVIGDCLHNLRSALDNLARTSLLLPIKAALYPNLLTDGPSSPFSESGP